MSFSLEFRPDARIEFDEAADWYEEQRIGLRASFVLAVDETLVRISTTPFAFPVVEGTLVRKAVISRFPYSIYYSVEGQGILIYSVFHHSRNPMIWRGRID